jgi:hypothetical protein
MTNARAGGKVARGGRSLRRRPPGSAAALSAEWLASENAGEMGEIRAPDDALGLPFDMPAALLCRILHLIRQPRQAVESERRSALIGTQNAS